MTGRIHSIQSLGTVDGPGVRCVVFTQGCPLRCICCHNPDTWAFDGGTETEASELVSRILRFRSYFGKTGGVTVSGGEPLMQAAFVTELFTALHTAGVHTALDTSGIRLDEEVKGLLDVTDLVLLDHKYPTEEAYQQNCGASLSQVLAFLSELEARSLPTWIRRVIIPGKTDSPDSLSSLLDAVTPYACVKKIELLPFRKLCLEKYRAMGIPFPLADTPSPDKETMERLLDMIPSSLRGATTT